VTTGRRGADKYTLTTYGKQSHSSGIFSERGGYGAIYEASRILDSFRTVIIKEKFLTSNPGTIAGGTTIKDAGDHLEVYGKDNIIASTATVVGDLRFLSEEQRRNARVMMKAIVDSGSLPGTHAEIQFQDGIPSMKPTAANKQLAAQFNQVNLDMGLGTVTEVDPMSRGAGDISFIAANIDCLDGIGPSGKGSHAPGETLNTRELPLLIQRAAIFMYRLTR
jgi:glutamate carboxypeptidase